MDLYEQLVEFYLTVIENCAVIPQFPVLFDKQNKPTVRNVNPSWANFPDFLAVDFGRHRVQVVEVSKDANPSKALDLLENVAKRRDKVESFVRWFTEDRFKIQWANEDRFKIEWRYFVRRGKVAKKLIEGLRAVSSDDEKFVFEVTELEEVFDKIRDRMP